MMPISCGQCRTGHLVDTDEQLRRVGRGQKFVDELVDFRVTETVNLRECFFLLVESLRNVCAASA